MCSFCKDLSRRRNSYDFNNIIRSKHDLVCNFCFVIILLDPVVINFILSLGCVRGEYKTGGFIQWLTLCVCPLSISNLLPTNGYFTGMSRDVQIRDSTRNIPENSPFVLLNYCRIWNAVFVAECLPKDVEFLTLIPALKRISIQGTVRFSVLCTVCIVICYVLLDDFKIGIRVSLPFILFIFIMHISRLQNLLFRLGKASVTCHTASWAGKEGRMTEKVNNGKVCSLLSVINFHALHVTLSLFIWGCGF